MHERSGESEREGKGRGGTRREREKRMSREMSLGEKEDMRSSTREVESGLKWGTRREIKICGYRCRQVRVCGGRSYECSFLVAPTFSVK